MSTTLIANPASNPTPVILARDVAGGCFWMGRETPGATAERIPLDMARIDRMRRLLRGEITAVELRGQHA